MLEKYYKYKVKYCDYIIMFKYGNFYETFSNDALIMNSIFNYKISKLSNTFKVGFPISSLENIIEKLNEKSINYVVLNKEETINKKFDNNNYKKYNFNTDIINYNTLLINEIEKYLNDNLLKSEISSKLEKIKEIIDE